MGQKKSKQRRPQRERIQETRDDEFSQMMEDSFQPVRPIEIGEEVEATVVDFDTDYVYLDLGSRLDGIVPVKQYFQDGKLLVNDGDKINVFVTAKRDGAWICTSRLGAAETTPEDTAKSAAVMALEDAFERKLPVEGKVTAVNKGGFDVEIMGQRTFCPISQIDRHYCETPEEHLEKAYVFEIIKFEEEGNNIVVSRRGYLEKEAEKVAVKMWRELDESKIYDGTVVSIQDFGVFIDIGGIEGLLHRSEVSYEREVDIHERFKVGDTVRVAVVNIDREKRKIGFSTKSLMDDPWTEAVKKLKQGGEFQGKVVRMKTFGAWIELFPGVDGMVHVSRLGTDRRHQHPKEVLKIGETVTVRVMEIDEASKKISLTMEKEEGDFSADLAKIKKDQEKAAQSAPTAMATLFDKALKPDKK